MQRNSKPLNWKIQGASDALDGTNSFAGAQMALTNLIPDPTTRDLWQCRPAAVDIVNFAQGAGDPFSSGFGTGFGGPPNLGFISVFKIVGNFLYGMAAQLPVGGVDVPFAVNLLNNTIISVGGTQNTTTLPASPPTTGAWIPPQMDVIGTKLMVAHPGFTGTGGNFIGWFDISNPSSPMWNAGNLTGGFIQFTIAPIAVKQFGNRAYYIQNNPIQPAVIFSDVLNATNCLNANQILTFNDNVALTALGALPLSNQLGGIIQSIMVFKNVTTIFQITGDAALSNLAVNALNVATGTLAPNSLASTQFGLAFVAPDGVRIIDFNANVSPPIGYQGQGISVPFIYAAVPSRIAAACAGTVLRVTTQNGNANNKPFQEYWFDFARKVWSGSHTFPASLIAPYQNTFIMTPVPFSIFGSLWRSDPFQSQTSVFVENGVQMTWTQQTVLLPDTEQMTNNAMTETTLDLALPVTIPPLAVVAADQQGTVIDSVLISPPQVGNIPIWGVSIWGQAIWGGGLAAALAPYQIPWHFVIVFARMTLKVSGQSALDFKIGALRMRYQILRQLTSTASAA